MAFDATSFLDSSVKAKGAAGLQDPESRYIAGARAVVFPRFSVRVRSGAPELVGSKSSSRLSRRHAERMPDGPSRREAIEVLLQFRKEALDIPVDLKTLLDQG